MHGLQTQRSESLRRGVWRGRNSWQGGAAAKTKLTYSHTIGINRAGPALGRAIVGIIQVITIRISDHDLIHEVQNLSPPPSVVVAGHDLSGSDVEGGEQSGSTGCLPLSR